jgi:TolB-like protein
MRAMLLLALVSQLAYADTRPTVAILYFDYSGKDPEMAVLKKGLAQMLISDLSGMDSVRLVERDRLEEVLAELKLGQTAKIDPQSAAKVGKLLGARYMVLGGYFDLMQTLRADARVVEVETGKVIQSVGANGKPEDFLGVEQKLSEGIGKILSEKTTPMTTTPTTTPPKNPPAEPNKLPRQGAQEGARRAERPKPPAKLKTSTALKYSRALHKLDAGDKEGAKKELQAVVQEQPDFRLATLDMDKLIQ